MPSKTQRHSLILRILDAHDVTSQEMLRELLAEEGLVVAQGTLSRDIRELGLAKIPDASGTPVYTAPPDVVDPTPRLARLLPPLYIGTDGVLLATHGSTPMLYPREKFTGFKYPKLEPRDHWKDFIDCCLKGGKQQPSANFDYAGPLTEAVLLGCLASAFPGENLEWDAPALKIPNSDAANAMVRRQYRPGWEV